MQGGGGSGGLSIGGGTMIAGKVSAVGAGVGEGGVGRRLSKSRGFSSSWVIWIGGVDGVNFVEEIRRPSPEVRRRASAEPRCCSADVAVRHAL